MRRFGFGVLILLGACEATPDETVYLEYMVIGNSMTFEQCRARGGLIIRDQGSPMIACDPHIIGDPVPMSELQ